MKSDTKYGLPPSTEDWVLLYRTGRWDGQRMGDGHRFYAVTGRVLEYLHQALTNGRVSSGYRVLGEEIGVSPGTVARIVKRMELLGALKLEGGEWHPGSKGQRGYRDRLSITPVWPPQPETPVGRR